MSIDHESECLPYSVVLIQYMQYQNKKCHTPAARKDYLEGLFQTVRIYFCRPMLKVSISDIVPCHKVHVRAMLWLPKCHIFLAS